MKKLILNTVLATAVTAVSVSAFAGFSDPLASTTTAAGFPGDRLVAIQADLMEGRQVPSVMTVVDKAGQPESSMVYLTYDQLDKQFTYSLQSGAAAAGKDISARVAFLVQSEQSSSDASYVSMSGEVVKVASKGKLVQFRFVPKQIKIIKAKVKGRSKRVSGSTDFYVFKDQKWGVTKNGDWTFTPPVNS